MECKVNIPEFVEKMNANAERIAKAFRTQNFDAVWDYV